MPTQTNQTKMTFTKMPRLRLEYLYRIYVTRAAINVSKMARVFFSTSRVATTRAAREKPMTRMVAGNPSLYMTIKKEKNTSARPVSFCRIVSIEGIMTMLAAIRCDLVLLKSRLGRERYFASARQTQTLQNSAG